MTDYPLPNSRLLFSSPDLGNAPSVLGKGVAVNRGTDFFGFLLTPSNLQFYLTATLLLPKFLTLKVYLLIIKKVSI